MRELIVETNAKQEVVDITADVRESVARSAVRRGMCFVYCPHTTAGVTVNESADPAVSSDLLAAFDRLVPNEGPWRHLEGNAPAHVKASLIGSSVTVGVIDGDLALGTWQGVFLAEFDGPRKRKLWVQILS
jgi:secondary thiamine-phosphate synthase enzyme